MSFWDVKEEKENAKKPIIRIKVGGNKNFNCPACTTLIHAVMFWVTSCDNCGQEIAVCNMYGQCDMSSAKLRI